MTKNIKKYNWRDPIIVKTLINKQLEKHGVDYEYIIANQYKIKKRFKCDWYQHYTFDTKEEFDAWKDFCIDFLLKNITPKPSLKQVLKEFNWFNLGYGLKQTYL